MDRPHRRLQESEELLNRGLQIIRNVFHQENSREGDFLRSIGKVCIFQGRHIDALIAFEEAENIYRRTARVNTTEMADVLQFGGVLLSQQGQLNIAAAKLEEAVVLRRGIVANGGGACETDNLD
mmetsp:Transcript_10283/g.24166  ORF Transcript_10283/g.24166 Transcript_10283/m.24166 type:complete len:124 (+) Transcript_10283:231-602(+)